MVDKVVVVVVGVGWEVSGKRFSCCCWGREVWCERETTWLMVLRS